MKTVAFVFGRFNPPTIGHGKLLDALKATAQREGADYYVFTSHSQDAKKNPLSKNTIFRFMSKMFPQFRKVFRQKYKGEIRNVFDIASNFHGEYDKLIMVVGSDRVSDFERILNKYNGIKAQHGFYDFKEIQVVSAGDRDPDAEGVTGMSASKMRAAAVKGDFDSFKLGVPAIMSDKDTKDMMNAVRVGLKLDTIREGMKRRRGIQEPVVIEDNSITIEPTELTWQGYETISLSTCAEAFDLFDEIVNSIGFSSFTTPEQAYLKESLILVDKCLTIANSPKEIIEEKDVQDYLKFSQKAIKLLESVGKRIGVPFDYSFLNKLQVEVIEEEIKPKKSFTLFIGEVHGNR